MLNTISKLLKSRNFWLYFDVFIFGSVLGLVASSSPSALISSIQTNILCGVILRLYFFNIQNIFSSKYDFKALLLLNFLILMAASIISFNTLVFLYVAPIFLVIFSGIIWIKRFWFEVKYPLSYLNRLFFLTSGFLFSFNENLFFYPELIYLNPMYLIVNAFNS